MNVNLIIIKTKQKKSNIYFCMLLNVFIIEFLTSII